MANAADVRRLVKKRGTIKAQITSFRTFLAEHREENQIDAIRVRSRVDRLKESFLAFNEICNELDQLDEDHDHTDDRISTEENYLDAISEAENLLIIANSSRAMHNAGNVAVAGLPENTANSPSYRMPRLKLPEASLPKFEGKYEQWLSFKDSFLAMIGDRDELSDVEKLQYLKASLSGDAARKLTMFTITGDNYSRAWELLKNSYQDERLIITRHLSLLIRLPVQERETAAGLTRLADETQQHVMSLQSLGVDVGDHIVVQLIVEKLSKYTRQKWEETLKRNIFPKLNELIEFLYGTASRIAPWESDTREGSSGYAAHKSTSGQGLKPNKTVRTFVTTVPAECPACSGEPHPLYRCVKFRENSVQNRIKIVQDAELCVNCLRSHGSRECRFGKCPRCDEHHNALLHQDLGASTSQAQN